VKQFIVLMDSSKENLQEMVNRRLQEGWQLESFCVCEGAGARGRVMYFVQTMTKD
jgi:hypothetical protein